MLRTALTRSLLVLVMSCAIACYSSTALHATALVMSQDTTTVAVDTLGTSLSDTLRTKASSEQVSVPTATQAKRQVAGDSTATATMPASSPEALQRTTAAQVTKQSRGVP
ncbi:MAG: hypothetical protein ACFN0U_04145, partial [Porphyromonas asaccharolytica]